MKQRVLLVHRSFRDPGGGNAVGAWAVQALRDVYDVTLLTWDDVDWRIINERYGTAIRDGDVRVARYDGAARRLLPLLPLPLALLRYALLQREARKRALRDGYDLVAGTSNEIDAPGAAVLQYVHFPFGMFPRPDTDLRWYHLAPLVRFYRAAVYRALGISRERIANNATCANSAWTAEHFRSWYGAEAKVLYPPAHVRAAVPPWELRDLRFVCAGRVSPEKRLVEIIAILKAVRRRGHDVRLTICGQRDDRTYERSVRAAVAVENTWVTYVLDSPRELLLMHVASCRFGIHGMIGEHFGLAPAEMLRSGCVTFAPREGGPAEILGGDERVLYDSDADAVTKICAVLDDPGRCADVRARAAEQADRFSPERFMHGYREACAQAVSSGSGRLSESRSGTRALRALMKRILPRRLLLGAGRMYRVVYPFAVRAKGPRIEEISTPTGRFRLPLDAPHDDIIHAIRSGELFEREVIDLARRFIGAGGTVIDVGANFGQMSVAFARIAGEHGRVIAIEANRFVHALLEQNLQLNGLTNAVALYGAAYRSSGETVAFPVPRFWKFPSYGSYGVDPRIRGGKRVPTIALDDLEFPQPVTFLKIDAQGSDLEVLIGARRIIARYHMPIVFEYERGYDASFGTCFADYESFIAEIGYTITDRLGANILIEFNAIGQPG